MNLKMESLEKLLLKNQRIFKLSERRTQNKNYSILFIMEEWINFAKTEDEVNQMSPLTWAYVGDCIFELYIRTKLVNETNLKPHKLHIEAIKFVKASAQAELLKKLRDNLTEEEQDIVRRTRNTQNHHLPKNSNVQEYMYATAFEGLFGYLYLTKQNKRLDELFKLMKIELTKS